MPLDNTPFIAPFVACTNETAKASLIFAQLCSQDDFMDLGCGNGQLLRAAIRYWLDTTNVLPEADYRKFCITGVELDPCLFDYLCQTLSDPQVFRSWLDIHPSIILTSHQLKESGICDSVQIDCVFELPKEDDHASMQRKELDLSIFKRDMFKVDLTGASVLVLYLLPAGLKRLAEAQDLENWLAARKERRIVTIDYAIPGWKITQTSQSIASGKPLHLYSVTK